MARLWRSCFLAEQRSVDLRDVFCIRINYEHGCAMLSVDWQLRRARVVCLGSGTLRLWRVCSPRCTPNYGARTCA